MPKLKKQHKPQRCPWCERDMEDLIIDDKAYCRCESCQISFRNYG